MTTFLLGLAGGAVGVLAAALLVFGALWLRTRILHRRGLASVTPDDGRDPEATQRIPAPVWPGVDPQPPDSGATESQENPSGS